jgi:hypothetical protein
MILKGREDFVQAITDLLGISRTTASKKISGETPFTSNEMKLIKAEYDLTGKDMVKIFIEDSNETLQTSK